MKFLFVAKQQRNASAFLDTLQALVARGHEVTVAVQERDEVRDRRLAEQVRSPLFQVVPCPAARMDEWSTIAPVVRRLRDAVHILQPQYADAPALQIRILDRLRQEIGAPFEAAALADALQRIPSPQMPRIDAALRLAEHALPTSDLFDEFFATHKPDVVLISPLIHFGAGQADVAASARRLGLPVWMLLFSWDNLSTKGCLQVEPDLMFVWNERQKAEAEELHRFRPSRVVVVGAARFDEFFALRPALTRRDFHDPLGLDASRPTLLYLCSSPLIAPRELGFIRSWLAAIRASASDALAGSNVVIRPHPDVALSDDLVFERLNWPAVAEMDGHVARPFADPRAVILRTSYKDPRGLYESLVHSDAVIGLNTTAELEAGITGRPVFTLQPGSADDEGPTPTVHFHYLTREHGGFVSVAATVHEHVTQLESAIESGVDPAPIRRFIESFLRPLGIDRPVSPMLADALIERAAGADVQSLEEPAFVAAVDAGAPAIEEEGLVRLDYKRARIVVRATPEAMRNAASGAVRLDRATVKWLERWIKIGDVLYDLSAGFGTYVLIAARQRGAAVVAFEPGYKAYAAMCDNVILNACQGAVIPVPLALAGRDTIANIKYGRGLPGAEYHSVQPTRWRPRASDAVQPQVHSVCATRLDTAVERYGLPAPNHIRLSQTGSAADVLRGAIRTLAEPTLRSVWIQAGPHEEETLVEILQGRGLHVAIRRPLRNAVQLIFSREDLPESTGADARREEIRPR